MAIQGWVMVGLRVATKERPRISQGAVFARRISKKIIAAVHMSGRPRRKVFAEWVFGRRGRHLTARGGGASSGGNFARHAVALASWPLSGSVLFQAE